MRTIAIRTIIKTIALLLVSAPPCLAQNVQTTVTSNVGSLNAQYANAIEAQGLLENRIAYEHGTGGWQAAVRKGEWGTALVSLLTGHPYLAVPFLANRIARSAPAKVLESRGAAAAGKAMQSPMVQKVSSTAAGAAGAQAGQAAASSNQKAENAEPWVLIKASDGKMYEIHPQDLEEAKRRDPNLKVLPTPK